MEINKRNFPKILLENENKYFEYLFKCLEAVDDVCHLDIIKLGNLYRFRIAPSDYKHLELLIKEILRIHKLFNIQVVFSKSIKTSSVITYNIKLV